MKLLKFRRSDSMSSANKENHSRLATGLATFFGFGLILTTTACGPSPNPEGTYTHPDCESDDSPVLGVDEDEYGKWQKVPLDSSHPDLKCADGSDYSFFIQYNEGATDLTVTLEPGGPCWDYDSCINEYKGQLFPENQDGETSHPHYMTQIPSGAYNQMSTNGYDPVDYDYHSSTDSKARPWGSLMGHFGKTDFSQPTHLYNHVFLPNCTADAFTGSGAVTYDDPNSGDRITMRHNGRNVVNAVNNWIAERFTDARPGQLVVLGASGGGLGAQVNYPQIRRRAEPKCSTLVVDSAPLFAEGSRQDRMKDLVTESWNISQLAEDIDDELRVEELNRGIWSWHPDRVADDWGNLPTALPYAFPEDRFIYTAFQRDLIFSAFSYVPYMDEQVTSAKLLYTWQEEVKQFARRFDQHKNVSYFFPELRPDLCSHVISILPIDTLYEMADSSAGASLSDLLWVGNLVVGGANPYEGGSIKVTLADNSTKTTYLGDVILSVLQSGGGTLQSSSDLPKLIAEDTDANYSEDKLEECFDYGTLLDRNLGWGSLKYR